MVMHKTLKPELCFRLLAARFQFTADDLVLPTSNTKTTHNVTDLSVTPEALQRLSAHEQEQVRVWLNALSAAWPQAQPIS